jgi:hypothetical protein
MNDPEAESKNEPPLPQKENGTPWLKMGGCCALILFIVVVGVCVFVGWLVMNFEWLVTEGPGLFFDFLGKYAPTR